MSGAKFAGQIEAGRAAEERARAKFYGEELPWSQYVPATQSSTPDESADAQPKGWWRRLWRRLFR